MFDALYIGATGMQAQQMNVDTIANNLANVNTTGFKKGRLTFSDLVTRSAVPLPLADAGAPLGLMDAVTRVGAGVGIGGMAKLFDMGDLKKTESAFDVAIEGDGFMEVTLPDGSQAYARGGTLRVNKEGLLATQAGYALKPGLSIPDSAQALLIDPDGTVRVRLANQATPVEIGQIDLVRFSNPQALLAQGDNLYRPTEAAGDPVVGKPGEEGLGRMAQGFLEGSNVKLVDEMVNLMIAQRAYEASVKVVQASDEMLGMVNALRR